MTTVRAWPPRVPSSHVARSRQPGGVSRPELGRIQAWSLQSPAPGLPPSASSHQEGTLLPRLASLGPQTGLAGCDTMGSAQRKDILPGHRPGGDSRRLGAPGAASEFGAGRGEGGWSARSPPPHPRVRGRLRPSARPFPGACCPACQWCEAGQQGAGTSEAPWPREAAPRPAAHTRGGGAGRGPAAPGAGRGALGQLTGPDANWTRGEVAEGSQPGAELLTAGIAHTACPFHLARPLRACHCPWAQIGKLRRREEGLG